MKDTFTRYEIGLTRLLGRLGKDHPRYTNALVYQQRLQENIAKARQFGDSETYRVERAQIVDALNRLAIEAVGISFNELCDPVISVGIQKIEGESIKTLDFQPEHTVSEGRRRGSLFAPLVRQYRSLPLKYKVTIVVALISLLGTLCRGLGAPVVGELAERLFARPDETEVAVLAPTHTVTPILLTSIPTSTPIPPTFTPTASPTPIPSFVFDFDDGTTQCWNVRTEPDTGSLGDRVTVTVNIGDNTSYALRFDVNLDSTTGYRSQIEYSKFYDCTDGGAIALLNKAVKLRADVFLPQDAPAPTSVEFWVQEGPERNWDPWYAGPSTSIEHGQWVTVEWQAGVRDFGLWEFPYQFGIEVKSESVSYRGPVYFDNITVTYQP